MEHVHHPKCVHEPSTPPPTTPAPAEPTAACKRNRADPEAGRPCFVFSRVSRSAAEMTPRICRILLTGTDIILSSHRTDCVKIKLRFSANMDGLVFAESLYACRRPYFLLVQKVGKDTPEGGKIQNLSPPSGLPPHSNWSRSGLLDNSPRIRTSILLSYLSLFVTFLPDMFVSFVSFIRYTIRLIGA